DTGERGGGEQSTVVVVVDRIRLVVFFFQAEDGIRDWSVTGVQTCALPICRAGHGCGPRRARLAGDEQVLAGGAAPGGLVRAEGVGVVHGPHLHVPFHLTQQPFDGGGVRYRVGGVGQDEGGAGELPDRAAQGAGHRAGIGERRIALGQLPGPRALQRRLVAPVHRQPFQEVIPLDVTVVVARRRV